MYLRGSFLVTMLLILCREPIQAQDTARVMFYNILNFPTGGGGVTDRIDTLQKIIAYAEPDVLLVCELVNSSGSADILNDALSTGGINYFQAANFVTNQSTSNALHNMCYFNSNLFGFDSQLEITTDLRDVNQYILYYQDPNLALTQDTTFIDFYATHLKAGTGPTNRNRRNMEAIDLRNHINGNTTSRNAVFGADLNVYNSNEPAYQTLVSSGNDPFVDPIAMPGNWSNNASFADIHTQSTRGSVSLGGASGGMDDRFDQILISSQVVSGVDRVQYIPGSYTALGQDGNHFNLAINAPPANTSVPQTIASALFYMSDHLPVILDLELRPSVVLPLTLGYFEAEKQNGNALIKAQLLEPETVSKVEIYRSRQGQAFEAITTLPLDAARHFSFLDQDVPPEFLSYQLHTFDLDGNLSKSPIVELDFQTAYAQLEFSVFSEQEQLMIRLDKGEVINGQLNVIDLNGSSVLSVPVEHLEPGQIWAIPSAPLNKGAYVIELSDNTLGNLNRKIGILY